MSTSADPPGSARPAWSEDSTGSRPETLTAAPRFSNRRLLLIGISALTAVALVFGLLRVLDAVRDGARSPAALASGLVAALGQERLPRLLGLVDPQERPALHRLAGALNADAVRFGLSADTGAAESLSPDGLQLDLIDVAAQTELISDDLAALDFRRGQLRVRIEPPRTRGLLAGYLGLRRLAGPSAHTFDLGSAGPQRSGLRVLAVRRQGRWYVSPLLTLLEGEFGADLQATGTVGAPAPARPAGRDVPEEPAGSETPEQAAVALIRAAVSVRTTTDLPQLGSALDPTGAQATVRYGPLFLPGDEPGQTWGVRTAAFDAVPDGPDRARVRVGSLTLISGDRHLDVGPTCVDTGDQRRCLHRSAYRYDGHAQVGWFDLLGLGGAFDLTAVRQDGRWRIGVADSLADAVIAGIGALSPEQGLALLQRVPLDRPSGRLVPGRAESVAFTSGGYAVLTLHVDRPGLYRVLPSPAGFQRGTVYTADGTPAVQKFFPNDDSYDLVAGDYTLLVWADTAFERILDGAVEGPYRQRVQVRRVPGS